MQKEREQARVGHNALVALGTLLGAIVAGAADYYVAPDGTGDYTLGNPGPSPVVAAQKATASGDVIHVAEGCYTNTAVVKVLAGVTLIGGSTDPSKTVFVRKVSGDNDRVVFLGIGATMRDMTVNGGWTRYQGAGVLGLDANGSVHKKFSVSNCIVENCSALYKGGGSFGGTWRNCIIRNCNVRNPYNNAQQEGSGGGIWGATLYDCVITNNSSSFAGGGIAGNNSEPCVAYRCLIAYNTAPYGAGAGTYWNSYSPNACRLYDCQIVSNSAHNLSGYDWGGRGGGTCGCFVTNSLIAWNKARIDNRSATTARGGGGVFAGRVYDSTILGNQTTPYGDAAIVDGGGAELAYLENCQIRDNTAVRYAGGTLYCTNVNCVISGNRGTIGGGVFGGLCRNCVITNNTACGVEGGAAYNATTYNCFVAYNLTQAAGTLCRGYHQGDIIVSNVCKNAGIGGAAVMAENASKLNAVVVNCTIADNVGGLAGVWNCWMTNSIVVGHAKDVSGAGMVGYSLWKTGDTSSDPTNLAGVDPMFVTEVGERQCPWSLKDTSPCVGGGLNLAWMDGATDILGNERLFKHNRRVDMGACECWWIQALYFWLR